MGYILKDIKNTYFFDNEENFIEKSNIDIVIKDGKFKYIGDNFTDYTNDIKAYEIIDCSNKCLIPSFTDPHTHLIFGGSREEEFFMRNSGVDYLEIASKGGGIGSSVKSTRSASNDELLWTLLQRIKLISSYGVSHLEVKSGYGLSPKDEIRMLKIIKQAQKHTNVKLIPTLLAAHDFPPELKRDLKNRGKYLDTIINEIIPVVKEENLAEFFDIFSEEKVFNLEQTKRLLKAAKDAGFKLKLHSDELSNIGASELGIDMGAISIDHLLQMSESGIKKLADSDTTGVLLPGTAFYLNKPYPKYNLFKKHKARVALASDCNPGSNFTENILFIYTLASIKLGMSAEEILKAATINASYAIDKKDNPNGIFEIDSPANCSLINTPNLEYLFYNYGINHIEKTFIEGVPVWINM